MELLVLCLYKSFRNSSVTVILEPPIPAIQSCWQWKHGPSYDSINIFVPSFVSLHSNQIKDNKRGWVYNKREGV